MNWRRSYTVCCAVVLTIVGLVIVLTAPTILKIIINKQLILTPKSPHFEIWKHFPVIVPMDFYFFNWTNPEDIYNKTVKPKFTQMGPYRFMVDVQKTNITWNTNGTVTYRQKKTWFSSKDQLSRNLEDNITTPNLIALGASHVARNWNYLVRKGLSFTLKTTAPTIHITRTVDELLFKGYPDPLMKIAKTFPFFVNTELPAWDKFGWFYERNSSSEFDGVSNAGTGINSIFGRLYSWNYWTKTPYFEGDCGKIDGSTGERFDPSVLNKNLIKFFVTEACRPVNFQYSETSQVGGILGHKYIVGDYMLDNGTKYEENKCFCNGECRPSGIFNVSSCRYGLPAFGSLPHFYQADPYFINSIEGLTPNKNKHEFYIIIEPNTGIVLDTKIRLQINLMMHEIPDVTLFEGISETFFPVMWFDFQIKTPENLLVPVQRLLTIPFACRVTGIILIIISLTMLVVILWRKSEQKKYSGIPLTVKYEKAVINNEDR